MLKRSSGAEHSVKVDKEGLSANPVRQSRSGECRHRHEVRGFKTGWGKMRELGRTRNQELRGFDWFHMIGWIWLMGREQARHDALE